MTMAFFIFHFPVFVCLLVCVDVCAPVEARVDVREYPLLLFHITPPGRAYQLNTEQNVMAILPGQLALGTCLCFLRLELQVGLHAHQAFTWASGDPNSTLHLHSCLATALTTCPSPYP